MGGNKGEANRDKAVSHSENNIKIDCNATTSSTQPSGVDKVENANEGPPKNLLTSELQLTAETKHFLLNLTTASPTDASINSAQYDAQIYKVISEIEARHTDRIRELTKCRRSLSQRKTKHRKRSSIVGTYRPDEGKRLSEVADALESDELRVRKVIDLLFNEKTETLIKLNSLRRTLPVHITDTEEAVNSAEKTNPETSQQVIKQALEITEQNLQLKSIAEVVKDETKVFLQNLPTDATVTNEQSITATEYNATIDKVVNDIVSSVDAYIVVLVDLKKRIHHVKLKVTKTCQPDELEAHSDVTRILLERIKDIQKHIEALKKEKNALVKEQYAKLKPIPLTEGQVINWHAAKHSTGYTQHNFTFEGHSATAIVAGNLNQKSIGDEETKFLKRLIQLRKLELQLSQKQQSLGHAYWKAYTYCYEILAELIDIFTPVLEPKNLLRPKGKLLNALLERFPPKFSRVKVTLTATDIKELKLDNIRDTVNKFTTPVSIDWLIGDNTIVSTSDGGSRYEDERNFTIRLNTIIEFALGAARREAARRYHFGAKLELAIASALLAKPDGVKELLDEFMRQPDKEIQDCLTKELADASETTEIVENVIRDLHCQIGIGDAANAGTPLPSFADNKELLQELERCTTYFQKQYLKEFLDGRQYSHSGHFALAAAKCIVGSDLREKYELLKYASQVKQQGPDYAAVVSELERFRPFVPADFALDAPKGKRQLRYIVPRNPPPPPKQPKPSVPAQPPKRKFVPPLNTGPLPPGKLSVKELTERVFGTPQTVDLTDCEQESIPQTADLPDGTELVPLSFDELRSMGVPIEDAKKLCQPQTKPQPGTPELKEFNPQLPQGFKKIKLPKGKKGHWYPERFELKPTDDMEGPNKQGSKVIVSGRPSNITLVAGDAIKPTPVSRDGPTQLYSPSNQQSADSGIKILSSANVTINMLPGRNQAPPAGQPSGINPLVPKPGAKLPQLDQPLQAKQQFAGKQQKQRSANPVQYTSGSKKHSQGQYAQQPGLLGPAPRDLSYPKGVPMTFLLKQQQDMESRLETGQSAPNPNNMPIWPTQSGHQPGAFSSTFTEAPPSLGANAPTFVQTNLPAAEEAQYSPSDVSAGGRTYSDMFVDSMSVDDDEVGDGSQSPSAGQKRLSAFQRLGPVAQAKKPKLTINLLFSKEDSVREVIDEQAERPKQPNKLVPVQERDDILASVDETVIKYLPVWPWKTVKIHSKKTAGPRVSKSSMIMEEEQMSEGYESNRNYIKVAVSKYPPYYAKEDVLDLLLETVSGKSLIPCFIEHTRDECMFMVLRSQKALLALHKKGLYLHENGFDMPVHISLTDLRLNNVGFVPRLVLGKRLTLAYDGEMKLDLEAFCLKSDISHFIYFPLNRPTNQTELVELQSGVSWQHLRELYLAKNRLSTIDGFDLAAKCPKLSVLDLSTNYLEKITALLSCRGLSLRSLKLEGNPLCTDYTDPWHYVKVVKMMFPTLAELDGVKMTPAGELPAIRQNYCPADARHLVERFLQVYFPLLDSAPEDRMPMEELYHENATLTITFRFKLRQKPIFRFRDLFTRCRLLDEGSLDSVQGAPAIAKHAARWPPLKHDPYTFVVDVLHHEESTTVVRVAGVLKITAETLAEDEHLLSFARVFTLHSHNGSQYRIHNEMLYWDEVSPELGRQAFQITTVKPKKLSLKMESAPDDDLKDKLIAIFMRVTNLNRKLSERCLELRNWELKIALEYFMKLLKLNSLDTLDVDED